jgi:Fe-S-cluster containining protein
MTMKYECDLCGICCQGTLIVEAFHLDAIREPRLLDADVTGKTRPLDDLTDDDRCIILAANIPCKFLGSDNRCTIYPTRPNVCVGMEAGDEQCREARESCGLPPLQPLQTVQA